MGAWQRSPKCARLSPARLRPALPTDGRPCFPSLAASPAARVAGATMMWGISGKLKKKYGVEGDVRECLYRVSADDAPAAGSVILAGLR